MFDLDHTLVDTPLDLAAMAVDMRALLERRCGPLAARPDRYRVGELLAWCQANAPDVEKPLWEIALDHERRAMDVAALEPGAREAVEGARAAGFATAVWTNNAREITGGALARFGLLAALDLVVTRDEMRALKPDPDGWRVIAGYFGAARDAIVVGDSWVDGLAAQAAGVPFVAYRPREADLARWKITPIARLTDLATLPAWLREHVRRDLPPASNGPV
ncbi:MAG TPA: HAD hydrolase-like protein [Methylomirabilota bacterium]|nr:HAD hydrolase-like protein [Methylomirabilota bacterium]